MKKNLKKITSLFLMLSLVSAMLFGCGGKNQQTEENQNNQDLQQDFVPPTSEPTVTEAPKEFVDYAAQVTLNMSSNTAKVEATVKTFVDGDTTHFNVSSDLVESGVFKARYLAINTPESTGKIEEYGKKASNFTKEKLSQATSIIIESDTEVWDIDSTGSRNLVWIWYKTSDSEEYRNLNIEILQNGLALANSSANNRYGSYCTAAIAQAKEQKLNLYSGQKDPDFYYGEAVELTLKELRTNIEQYNGVKVAFNGIVTKDHSNSVYVEAYDEETGIYYGVSVYYGFNLSGPGLAAIAVGNEARIVGTVQYYEAGGTYQVAGLSYRMMKPDDPNNVQMISEGHEPAFVLTTADTFVNGMVEVEVAEEMKSFPYAEAAMSTSISMAGLQVKSVYTTMNEDSSSYGAMTLNCEADGIPVAVRTVVLTDANGNLITAEAYEGKNIDVRGIIDFFDGQYQIKVFSAKDITIK
ncbi:MAG: thermonuclease family protein [Lachnospiraceae bacterium]|nr:thermonuclease family protein [Lachnospiraceae bacterium]